MDEEHIEKIKQILTDWNPLGERANQVPDLDNYETETIDILFYIDKKSSSNYINKIMVEIITEAFGVDLNLKETIKYAHRIREIIK
nr:hypothetical protein [uncultured Draconibacterium sp.]